GHRAGRHRFGSGFGPPRVHVNTIDGRRRRAIDVRRRHGELQSHLITRADDAQVSDARRHGTQRRQRVAFPAAAREKASTDEKAGQNRQATRAHRMYRERSSLLTISASMRSTYARSIWIVPVPMSEA